MPPTSHKTPSSRRFCKHPAPDSALAASAALPSDGIRGGNPAPAARFAPAASLCRAWVGLFLADVVSFLILAAALFFFIGKFLGWLMKAKAADAAEAAPEPTKEEKLLTEIRDLLKARA